jgi:hypothetical protein
VLSKLLIGQNALSSEVRSGVIKSCDCGLFRGGGE